MIKKALTQETLQAVRNCGAAVFENATYVLGELDNVRMHEVLRVQTKMVCEALIGTNHDFLSELPELHTMLTEVAKAAVIWSRVSRIMRRLVDDSGELIPIVDTLDSNCEKDKDMVGAYLLISESATNVLRAVDETRNTVKRLKAFYAKTVEMTVEDFDKSIAQFEVIPEDKQAKIIESVTNHLRFNELFKEVMQKAKERDQSLEAEEAVKLVQRQIAREAKQQHHKQPLESDFNWNIEIHLDQDGSSQQQFPAELPEGASISKKPYSETGDFGLSSEKTEADRQLKSKPANSLPKYSAHAYAATGQVFFALRGGKGFVPAGVFVPDDEAVNPQEWNKKHGVTKADAAAMLAGTLIGWDSPLARAPNYDEDGGLINVTLKDCADARLFQARLKNHRDSFLDWPNDLSGDNLLVALRIIEERMDAYRQPQEVDSKIRLPEDKPDPLETVAVIQLDISNSDLTRLRAERSPLSNELIYRIERIMPVFEALYTPSLLGGSASLRDEWIEGFDLDVHPEREVEIWEWMAESLLTFARSEVFTFDQFEEAFKLLKAARTKSKADTMREANLQILTAGQVKYLLSEC